MSECSESVGTGRARAGNGPHTVRGTPGGYSATGSLRVQYSTAGWSSVGEAQGVSQGYRRAVPLLVEQVERDEALHSRARTVAFSERHRRRSAPRRKPCTPRCNPCTPRGKPCTPRRRPRAVRCEASLHPTAGLEVAVSRARCGCTPAAFCEAFRSHRRAAFRPSTDAPPTAHPSGKADGTTCNAQDATCNAACIAQNAT